MIGSTLSLVIELIMAMLLVVTISYCFIVNRKLNALRTDQSGMRHVIGELNRSTERAENAIRSMRQTALMVEGQIAGQVNAAQQASEELGQNLERSKELRDVARKLSDIDINALRAIEKDVNPAAISADQIELSKKLKRQRLGFGQNRFTPAGAASPRNEAVADRGVSEAGEKTSVHPAIQPLVQASVQNVVQHPETIDRKTEERKFVDRKSMERKTMARNSLMSPPVAAPVSSAPIAELRKDGSTGGYSSGHLNGQQNTGRYSTQYTSVNTGLNGGQNAGQNPVLQGGQNLAQMQMREQQLEQLKQQRLAQSYAQQAGNYQKVSA